MVQKRGFFQGETIIKVPFESLWVKKNQQQQQQSNP